jgi:predicted outer membrane repeat protein
MTRTGSYGVGPGAGSAPRGPSSRTMRWGAAGAAVAATVAAAMSGASAMAAPVTTFRVGCSVTALANAINFAPSDAILSLRSGCTYRLTASLPNVTSNLTLQGNGDTITRRGNTDFTALTVVNAQLIINRLTMRGFDGNGANPGALDNNGGTVTITKSFFLDNAGEFGGAILNDNGGTLEATSTVFAGNDALDGGAIENRNNSTATLDVDTFAGNDAATGGAIFIASGHVTVEGTSTAAAASTQFVDNDATGGGSVVPPASKNAPALPATGFGGAIDNFGGVLSATFATFTGNDADSDGGAIWNGGGASSVGNSGFTGNFADDDGGAIATTKSLSLASDTLSLNRANDDGGGIYVTGGTTTLNRTDVFANSAGDTGGGIRDAGGTVSLTNGSLVTLNRPNNCSGFFC